MLIKEIGLLRHLLLLIAATVVLLSGFSGDHAVLTGWAIVPTLIVPSIVPIVFFVLLLDILMSGVFKVDADEPNRKKFTFIMLVDLLLVVLIVIFWLPYFLAIGS